MADQALPARHQALDGLRGVGIVVVIGYHLGIRPLAFGWVLLDAFFVVSGYLITTLLLDTRDRAALFSFWGRRLRRLLPLAALVVAAVCITAPWWMAPDLLEGLRADALAALAYVSNWHSALQSADYDAPAALASPLVHYWTLSIEEQFYLLWPLVVLACARSRAPARSVLVVSLVLAAASGVAMALAYSPADPWYAWFATHTHAHGLALGSAAAALTCTGVPARWHRPLGLAAPVLLAVVLAIGATWPLGSPGVFLGGSVAACVLTAALVVALTLPGPLTRLLSARALTGTGRLSYGLYLWHWPVIVLLAATAPRLPFWAFATVAVAVIASLALGSWLALERPLATAPRPRLVLVGTGLCTAALLAAATLPSRLPPPPERPAAAARIDTPGGLGVVLVGDSVADSLAPGLRDLAGDGVSITTAASSGCGWASASGVADVELPDPQRCAELRAARPNMAARADVVVVAGFSEALDRTLDGRRVAFGTPEADRVALAEMESFLASVPTARLVVVGNAPPGPAQVAPAVLADTDGTRAEHLNELLARFAADHPDRVVFVDPTPVLCPQLPCPEALAGSGRLRQGDGRHYSEAGARLVARPVLEAAVAPR